jgi:hypothetical protein
VEGKIKKLVPWTIISLGFLNIPRTGKLEFLRVCCSTAGTILPVIREITHKKKSF